MEALRMRRNDTRGFLVTFCGLDGCGKTTMINRLVAELKNKHNLFLTKQPTNAVRQSEIFRNYQDSPVHDDYDYRSLSLLAASDRVQHVNKVISPALNESKIVISDRYFYSCLANLRARGYTRDRWIYDVAGSIIKPDIAFFLDIPVGQAIARVRRRPEEKNKYIDMDLQYKLRQEYVDICVANDGVLISSDGDAEKTFEKVFNVFQKKWNEKLWASV